MMRTYMKKVLKAVDAGDKTAAESAFNTAKKVLAQMAHKGLIHKNNASRHTSNLCKKVKAMA